MRAARTWGWPRTHRYDGRSNDAAPLPLRQFYPGSIITIGGYNFREGQVEITEPPCQLPAKIRDHGGVAEVLTYGGVGHLTLIGAFAPGLRVLAPVLHDATQFVWRVTRRQADQSIVR